MTTANVLVTGTAGFIGSSLAYSLAKSNYNVLGLDVLPPPPNLANCNNFSYQLVDLSTPLDNQLPSNIDFICHLAGQSSGEISFDAPVIDLHKNTVSTLNLISYAIAVRCKHFFYASSMSVYGDHGDFAVDEQSSLNPLSCYGVSKLASEKYLNVFRDVLPSTSLRMFNVYGPGQNLDNLRQGMVSIYLAQAHKFSHIEVKGSKDRFRDFIYIDDVVDVWVRCLTNYCHCPSVLNVGTGVKTTVDQLLQKILLLYHDTTIQYLNPTPGDQLGIYADVTALNTIMNGKVFKSLDVGLQHFCEAIQL